MFAAYLRMFPWDLLDDDLESMLDRLHGDVGLSGISLWMALPPTEYLRSRCLKPRFVRSGGGLLFPFNEAAYVGTRCKPLIADWVRGKEPLRRIGEACAKRGLSIRAVISASRTGRLAHRYPEMACKSVFQDPCDESVCLSHPDVRSFLSAMVSDLSSREGVGAVVLSNYLIAWTPGLRRHREVDPPGLGDVERILISTCFCESCHQRAVEAGVDVAAARRCVEVLVSKALEAARPGDRSLSGVLADSPPLAAYFAWRSRELSQLLECLSQASKCELVLERYDDGMEGVLQSDLEMTARTVVLHRGQDCTTRTVATCAAARRNELLIPTNHVEDSKGPKLVSALARAAEAGFAAAEFDGFDRLPDSWLTTVKQAVRFARRTTAVA